MQLSQLESTFKMGAFNHILYSLKVKPLNNCRHFPQREDRRIFERKSLVWFNDITYMPVLFWHAFPSDSRNRMLCLTKAYSPGRILPLILKGMDSGIIHCFLWEVCREKRKVVKCTNCEEINHISPQTPYYALSTTFTCSK